MIRKKIQGDFFLTNMCTIKVGWLINILHNLSFIENIVRKKKFISNVFNHLGNNKLFYFYILRDFESEKLAWRHILPQLTILNGKVYVARFFQNNFCSNFSWWPWKDYFAYPSVVDLTKVILIPHWLFFKCHMQIQVSPSVWRTMF